MPRMEFWIKDEVGNILLLLPVTPTKYNVTYGNAIETVQGIVGDINIPTSYKLSTVVLEGFFTIHDTSYTNRKTYHVNSCMDYVELIKMLIAYRRIIRLIITNDNITRLNLPYFIESIDYEESDGSGDINYKITFREYRVMNNQVTSNSSTGNNARISTDNSIKSDANSVRNHTVTEYDTLRKLARKYYNNEGLWTKIYNANKDKIKIPEKIYPGQIFIIP